MTFDNSKAGASVIHTKAHPVNGTVTVTIRDKHTGKPFTKPALVTLAPPPNEQTPIPVACNGHGKAVFTGLGTGRYIAAASFLGYSFVPEGEWPDGSAQLTLLAFKRKDTKVYWGIDSNLGNTTGTQVIDLDHAKQQEISFIGRYVSRDVHGPKEHHNEVGHKKLSRNEAPRYKPYGIALVAIWERTKYRAIELANAEAEYRAGKADAHDAMHQLDKIGAPPNAVCYFTADFDLTRKAHPASGLYRVQRYFEGVNEVVGDTARVGVYGTYDCIMRLYEQPQPLVRWSWQMTFGAKGLVIDDRVSIYQYDIWPSTDGWGVAGPGALDLDCAVRDHYGQFFI